MSRGERSNSMPEQTAKSSTWRDAPELVGTLKAALRQFDFEEADRFCGDLANRLREAMDVFPEDPARQILAALRRKRRSKTMETIADAFIRNGQSAPQIRRQYAQAMIDQSNLTA